MKKGIIAFISLIIGLIIILFTFFLPWYGVNIKNTNEYEGDLFDYNKYYNSEQSMDYHLTQASLSMKSNGNVNKQSFSYSFVRKQASYYGSSYPLDFINIFDTTFLIFIIGLIFMILTLVIIPICFFTSPYQTKLKNCGLIFGVVSLLVFLASFTYFTVSWNNYIHDVMSFQMLSTGATEIPAELADYGFWYSFNKDGYFFSMGPGLGWYLLIIGIIVIFISLIFLYKFNTAKNQQIPQTPYYTDQQY